METTFSEMRCKQVINVADGSLLGHIVDLVFDIRTSRILGFVVPGCKQGFSLFKPPPEIFIPYCNICKIGEDVVLVEVCNLPPRNRRTKVLSNAKALGSAGGQYQNPQDYESVTISNKANVNSNTKSAADSNVKTSAAKSDNRNYYIDEYEENSKRDDNFLNK